MSMLSFGEVFKGKKEQEEFEDKLKQLEFDFSTLKASFDGNASLKDSMIVTTNSDPHTISALPFPNYDVNTALAEALSGGNFLGHPIGFWVYVLYVLQKTGMDKELEDNYRNNKDLYK